jgi:ABC-type antimicrobial peptide transport system permease subunit
MPDDLGQVVTTHLVALPDARGDVGLYGLVAYSVNERRRELWVRMALGADRRGVLGLVLRDGMTRVLIGVAIGVGLSLLIARAVASLLLSTPPTDAASFAGAVLLLIAVAFIGTYLLAHRVSRLDPLVALRQP